MERCQGHNPRRQDGSYHSLPSKIDGDFSQMFLADGWETSLFCFVFR